MRPAGRPDPTASHARRHGLHGHPGHHALRFGRVRLRDQQPSVVGPGRQRTCLRLAARWQDSRGRLRRPAERLPRRRRRGQVGFSRRHHLAQELRVRRQARRDPPAGRIARRNLGRLQLPMERGPDRGHAGRERGRQHLIQHRQPHGRLDLSGAPGLHRVPHPQRRLDARARDRADESGAHHGGPRHRESESTSSRRRACSTARPPNPTKLRW